MNWIGFLLLGFLILLCLAIAVSGFLPRRTIIGKFDKTTVYLLAEYSYKPQLIESLAEILNLQNSRTIRVPLSVTWAGAVKPQFQKISNIGAMFSGLFTVFLFSTALTGYVPVYNAVFDWYMLFIVLLFIVVTLGYYYRSVASDLSSIEEKYIITAINIKKYYFNKEVLDEFDMQVVDQIYSEIKLDLDIHKTNVGFGGILLLLVPVLVASSSKFSDAVPPSISIFFTIVIAMTTLFKWMYENYRSRVIYIGANAVTRIKLMQRQQSKEAAVATRNLDRGKHPPSNFRSVDS